MKPLRRDLGMKFGGHVSMKNGLAHVVAVARALDYNVIQVMLGGGRDYSPPPLSEEAVDEFKGSVFGVELYVHLPYIINPCEDLLRRKGFYLNCMRKYMQASEFLGAKAVVLHPGYRKELSQEKAMANCLAFLEKAVAKNDIKILLETDSGSKNGSAVGSLEFIQEVITTLESPQIRMCLDTVHLYARGLSLWEEKNREAVFDQYGGVIELVHLNSPDPEVTLGSFLDRHNTPFSERTDLDHGPMIVDLLKRYPCVLERRSLAVQAEDVEYVSALWDATV